MRLSDRTISRAWWASVAVVAALFVSGIVLRALATGAEEGTSWGSGGPVAGIGFIVMTLMFPVAGAFVTRSQPRNRIGWVLIGIGLVWALDLFCTGFASFFWLSNHRFIEASHVFVAIDTSLWVPAIGLTGTFLLLLFPDGNLPGPRWRWLARVAGAAIVLGTLLLLFLPGPEADTGFPRFRNPLGISALKALNGLEWIPIATLPIAILASAAAVIVRYRRSRGAERLQMKWLAAAGFTVAFLFALAMLPLPLPTLRQDASLVSFGLVPAAVVFAVLRYRLYDIDVVINRSLVYGALAIFITAVYVAIVVGIGAAIGQGSGSPNLGLSILATAVVALSFGAVRERVQRVANRLVYGKRATPYQVLSDFSSRMAGSYATEDLLPRVARLLAEATGAERSEVWLRLGQTMVRDASWPAEEGDGAPTAVRMADQTSLPELPGAERSLPVTHQGELLGALALRKPRGESLTPADEKVAADLAGQAGLVLRNVRLVEELKASRQRIVAAQDEERRRLERDIHDGAQQDLVTLSLATKLAAAKLPLDVDPRVRQMLDQAAQELAATLSELRELARGIHPAILTERGLPAALESLAERSVVPAAVRAPVEERFDATIEATAYFAVSEALQNVAKYAKASRVEVSAERMDGHLVVRVRDDGVGGADALKGSGLRGLADRVAAVSGSLDVESPPGSGTTVVVRLPAAV
jgi:signal transduction histidine kinase